MEELRVGQSYDYYDDGKIRDSRHDRVTITRITTFHDIDSETLNKWQDEKKSCNWLYATDTDFFITGVLEKANKEEIFVRAIDGGWFGLGFWSGRIVVNETDA